MSRPKWRPTSTRTTPNSISCCAASVAWPDRQREVDRRTARTGSAEPACHLRAGRRGTLRQGFRLLSRTKTRRWRALRAAANAVHGHAHRDSIQPGNPCLLYAPHRRRQTAQSRLDRVHAQARDHPERHGQVRPQFRFESRSRLTRETVTQFGQLRSPRKSCPPRVGGSRFRTRCERQKHAETKSASR